MDVLKRQDVGSERLKSLEEEYERYFTAVHEFQISVPGRTELGGNHTDHNLGKVLCGAINLDSIACAGTTDDNRVTIFSHGYKPVCVDLSDLAVKKEEEGTTAALVRGIASSLTERNGKVGGFNAVVDSLVLPGSGLSSSASIEVLIGGIFNRLYNGDSFSSTELAMAGRYAENNYYGKPCGLMDQLACAAGGIAKIDFIDKNRPEITPVDVDFGKSGYSLVIVDTKSGHQNLQGEYASITKDMSLASQYFGKSFLREVSETEFNSGCSKLKDSVGERAFNRARHFFDENRRVELMCNALEHNNFELYLELVNKSGRSSETLLKNIVPEGTGENRVSLALEIARGLLGGRGAYRVHGGGFAGTIQCYVPLGETGRFIAHMNRYMEDDCCMCVSIRNKGIAFIE